MKFSGMRMYLLKTMRVTNEIKTSKCKSLIRKEFEWCAPLDAPFEIFYSCVRQDLLFLSCTKVTLGEGT